MTEREIRNVALADAIARIERLHGNSLYQMAWKRAAKELKNMMVEFNVSIADKTPQISKVS
jgi:hypothetical protein